MERTEKSLVVYASLLIGLSMCTAKLLATRNSFIFNIWRFDLLEIAFQFAMTVAYCYLLFFINLYPQLIAQSPKYRKYFLYVLINSLVFLVFVFIGGAIHYKLFGNNQLILKAFWSALFTRFTLSTVFVLILVKMLLLFRERRRKDNEHQLLRTSYLEAELELLKEQMNPHFLFNALSSLSGIIREDAALAQQYVNHLSKVFRYALIKPGKQLVTVADELRLLESYAMLLTLRFEAAFKLEVNVEPAYLHYKLPHLSLQPLVENASKHNMVTAKQPLHVRIYNEGNCLVVQNDLIPLPGYTHSTGLGLANLDQRYKIVTGKEIEISKTAAYFIVKLPLVP